MLLTILSTIGIETGNNGVLLGYGLLAGFIVAISLSSQRWLLGYMLGGAVYWLCVEALHNMLISSFGLSDWNSYVAAMAISWSPLAVWVLYRALRYEDVSRTVQKKRELAAARYIEHSPVYDDNYQPRF